MSVRPRLLPFLCFLLLINLHCFKYTLSDFLNADGPPPKDEDVVGEAKGVLAIVYAEGDSAESVTQDITLPTAGAGEVVITWESSHSDIIAISETDSADGNRMGVVTRPESGENDAEVTLTATLTKNEALDTKTFDLTVLPEPVSDDEAVMRAIANLAITYAGTDTAMSVTGNVTLPLTGSDGVVISWASDNDAIDVLTTPGTGAVTRPDNMDTDVTLTATLTKNAATDTQTFTLTVIITDAGADTAAVANAKSTLAIGYSGTDTAMSVTGNVTLPLTGSDGVMISWMSSNPGIISDSGMVTRPDDMDTDVRLTATLTKGAATDTTTFTLTVIITDAGADTAAVANAKSALAIGYSGTDTTMSVTEDVTLPATGANGVVITWMSSNTSVISTAGVVTRPDDMNTDVRLTATLTKGAATDTTIFTLTVIITDAGADTAAVANAKSALAIGYSGTDTAMSVTGNVTLPTTGSDGVSITWMSSDTGIISDSGMVTRPDDMNTDVRLTATLTKGAATDTTTFTLTVIISDAGAITRSIANLAIGYSGTDTAMSVTGNVTLPATGSDGIMISWMSSNTSVISTAGVVTRPDDMDTDVRLTATLTKGAATDTTTFTLTVIITDAGADTAAVANAKSALAIGYSGTDTAMSVTGNVTLPATGSDGVVISWMSSNTSVISTAGVVTRPDDMDTDVILTATLTKNAATDTQTFTLTVIISADGKAVQDAKTDLAITYSGTETASNVTGDVTLPTTGANGVVISWASSNTSVISTAGVVTRPTDMDGMVTLTATLTKNAAMATKTFTLVVPVLPDAPNLINIESVAQLIAMRYDADGNGTVDDMANQTAYQMAFPGLDTMISWEGYELTADLDLSGNNWTPQPNITAIFEGNGNTLSNLTISGTTGAKWSFFAEIGSGGHVRNLALSDVDVTGTNSTGSLAGLNNGTITGCSATGTVTATNWFIGGLVGENTGTIIASHSSVTVDGGQNETGGLVGKNTGTIAASYATGNVNGDGRSVGGLAGENRGGTIAASYATGNVTADNDSGHDVDDHGGLVGANHSSGVIRASYATGNVDGGSDNRVGGLVGRNQNATITASYSIGMVTGTGSSISRGGLLGVSISPSMFGGSYFDTSRSGTSSTNGGRSTSALQTPTEYGTNTYAGWNIDVDNGLTRGVDNGTMAGDAAADDPWDFGTSSQYPALKVDFNGDGTATVAEFGSQR